MTTDPGFFTYIAENNLGLLKICINDLKNSILL